MKKPVTAFFLILILMAAARAGSVLPENLAEGKPVPGSASPDGKICLLEVFHGETTQNSVIFASADRARNLGATDITTLYSTDIPYKGRTTVLWSPDSGRVAVHDAISKHSVLTIYRVQAAAMEAVPVPDLLAAACAKWGIARATVASSGQRPVRWDAKGNVTVTVSAKQKGGAARTATLTLAVPAGGGATLVGK